MFEMPENIWRQLTNAAADEANGAARRQAWATVLHLVPFRDGAQWCVLYGPDLQTGIAGFGDTPDAAIWNFELKFTDKREQ